LERAGLAFDSVLGFSVGALTGAYYSMGLMEDAVERWRLHRGGTLRLAPRLFPPSLFSNMPIREAVAWAGDDEQAKARARCRLVVVSSLCSRQRAIYPVFTPEGRGGWDAPLLDHLLASCAIPLVFPRVRLGFRGEELALFDGGVACAQPMSFEALGACRDVIALEVVRREEEGRRRVSLLREIDQRARETMLLLFAQGLGSLRARSHPPRVYRLAPSRVLEFTMLDFNDVERIRQSLDLGTADALGFLERPEGFAER
jgi:predicted acylesterase/phospholipase RssA